MKHKINLNIKKSSINNASSNVKIAYSNLEQYDNGNYKVSQKSYKKIMGKIENEKRN